jgi:hypothetical protein
MIRLQCDRRIAVGHHVPVQRLRFRRRSAWLLRQCEPAGGPVSHGGHSQRACRLHSCPLIACSCQPAVLFLSQSLRGRLTPCQQPVAHLAPTCATASLRCAPLSCRCSSHVVHRVVRGGRRPQPTRCNPETPRNRLLWLANAPRTYLRLVEGPKALAVAIARGGPRPCFEERVALQLQSLRMLYQFICHVLPPRKLPPQSPPTHLSRVQRLLIRSPSLGVFTDGHLRACAAALAALPGAVGEHTSPACVAEGTSGRSGSESVCGPASIQHTNPAACSARRRRARCHIW